MQPSLLHLQEVGFLTAIQSYTSNREKRQSYLCFVVKDREEEFVYSNNSKLRESISLVALN